MHHTIKMVVEAASTVVIAVAVKFYYNCVIYLVVLMLLE